MSDGPASSLLADIVATRALQPEPVATDALVHLLGRSPAGRSAILTMVQSLLPSGEIGELTFSSQVVAEGDPSRPDVVGADERGIRLVLEAKFDAELTSAQLGLAYLDRLSSGSPGALVFLVPEDRLRSIWPRLLAGPIEAAGELEPRTAQIDDQVFSCDLKDGRVVAAVSWQRLMTVLRQGLEAAAETHSLADLAQIEGLVRWRTRTGWTPLVPGDLPERAGRQLNGLREAMLRAAGEVSQGAGRASRNGSGDNGPGRYVSTPSGRWFWAGAWLLGWSRFGMTPLWALVRPLRGQSIESIEEALSSLDSSVVPRLFRHDGNWVAVPLVVAQGEELERIADVIVHTLKDVGARWDLIEAPPGEGTDSLPVEGDGDGPAETEVV